MIEIVTNKELNLINSFSEYKVILGTNPYNNCYYMKIDNQIIGFIEYAKIYDKAELNFIFVKEEYRKKGYAKELLYACEIWSKEIGCKEFASDCELENLASFKFHMAMGFAEANRIICFRKML